MRLKHHIGSILLVMGAILLLYTVAEMNATKQTPPSFDTVLSVTDVSPSPTKKHTVVGWIKETEEEDALVTLATSSGTISIVSPQWYQLTEDGELDVIFSPYKADIIQSTKESNVSIVPSLTDFKDASRTSLLLINQSLQIEIISQLIQTAKTQEFAGYNLDFNVLPEQGEDFTSFVKKLHTALVQDKRILSLTVPSKVGKGADSLQSTAYDWVSLGQLADSIHIKMYDEGSKTPPTAFNINYFKDTIAYAKTTIPNHKISLVLPVYSLIERNNTYIPISYSDMRTIVKNNPIVIDPASQLGTAIVGTGINQQRVYIENAESINYKITLAHEQGIYTIGLWYLGTEDADIWNKLLL